ncbi:HAMP domain-containing sensor histidine kinase [Brevibacterium sp.]|uniref:sensor histidine kinase n=1 Tax=Brevibacterium sp. TaxID=1701 RepID=UPI0025BFA9A8|nr:HAMP domain-containing sensor histidine kinase [Brevibacterium sp.]
MHERLIAIYLGLLIAATIGLAVPFALAVLDRASTNMLLDRTADAARFSSLAGTAVLTGEAETLTAELEAYEDLYGIAAVLVDADGELVAGSSAGTSLRDLQEAAGITGPGPAEPVMLALAGVRQDLDERIWPWSGDDLLVAEPVNDSGETIGAVVTASPTAALRHGVAVQWAVAAAGVALVLLAGAWAARPLSRWVLRPVTQLAEAAEAVSRGHLETRVSEGHGPGELRGLARAFNRMNATIAQMLERQRQFVAYAGHQIRNPLAVVRLRVESLGLSLPPEQSEAHMVALEELDRLTRTCESLLTLARSAEVEPERITADVSRIAHARARAWAPIAQELGASLEVDVPPALVVRCVEHTLDQTLDVLIDNALKFGGRGVRVRVSAERRGEDGVHISVEDDGPGLPEHLLHAALVPFWRSEPERRALVPSAGDEADDAMGAEAEVGSEAESWSSTGGGRASESGSGDSDGPGGSGLGLSVVVTLLELDGGRLELQPVQPHGSRAVVTLSGAR